MGKQKPSGEVADAQLGARIRELREAQGLSLQQLGDAIGVTRQQMGRLELGERRLKSSDLEDIAARLGTTVSRLLDESNPVLQVMELFEIMGYRVSLHRRAPSGADGAVALDLVAAVVTGPLSLQVGVLVRASTSEGELAQLSDLILRTDDLHSGIVVCDAEPPAALIAFASGRSLRVISRRELTAQLMDVKPYAESLRARALPAGGADPYVQPEILDLDRERPEGLFDLMDRWLAAPGPQRMLMLGDAGVGKSRAALAIAGRLAGRYLSDPLLNPAPILVRLWEFTYAQDAMALLFREIESRYSTAAPSGRALGRLLADGRFVLLLDGLDEMSVRLDPYQLRRNLRALSPFLSTRSNVLITARRGTFRPNDDLTDLLGLGDGVRGRIGVAPRLTVTHLLPFGRERVEAFLRRAHPRAWERSLAWIDETDLWELAGLPLILEQLPLIFVSRDRSRGAGPRTLPAVLEEAIRVLALGEKSMPADELIGLWERVAVASWRDNQQLVDLDKLSDDHRSVLGRHVDELRAHRGDQGLATSAVLLADNSGRVRFTHRLYYQYVLLRRVFSEVAEGSADLLRNFWFDQELVRLARGMVGRPEIERQLIAWLAEHREDGVRDTAAYLLGLSGSRDAVAALRGAFEDEAEDATVRSTAAHALVRAGHVDIIRDLGRQAGVPRRSSVLARMQLVILRHEEGWDSRWPVDVVPAVRAEMASWDESELVGDIIALLQDSGASEPLRCIAARVAGLVGAVDALLVLEDLRSLQSYRLRSAACEALEQIRVRSQRSRARG